MDKDQHIVDMPYMVESVIGRDLGGVEEEAAEFKVLVDVEMELFARDHAVTRQPVIVDSDDELQTSIDTNSGMMTSQLCQWTLTGAFQWRWMVVGWQRK
jgi:hypothetical protein